MSLVRSIDNPNKTNINLANSTNTMPLNKFFITLVVAIALGTLAGFGLGHAKDRSISTTPSSQSTASSDDAVAKTAGVEDKKTFKDEAQGDLKDGGIEGEGSFHLVRPGGESQYVYLTSSTVDLSKYIGKKVKVHGVTIAGQKAGWLMDVGYVELLQ
jgi:hypothetical protein